MELFPFPTVRDKQDELIQEWESAIENGESLVAHAPTGLGKCVSGDTQVLTSDGIGKIENLEYEKYVKCNSFDQDLKQEESSGFLVTKKDSEVLELETHTGRELKATHDHKLLRLKNGEVEWVRAEELEKGDYVASPRCIELPDVEFSLTLADVKDESLRIRTEPGIFQALKDVKNEEDRDLEKNLQVPQSNFTLIRNNELVRVKHAAKLVEKSSMALEDFEIVEMSKSNRNNIFLPEIDTEFSYFLGLKIGRAHV